MLNHSNTIEPRDRVTDSWKVSVTVTWVTKTFAVLRRSIFRQRKLWTIRMNQNYNQSGRTKETEKTLWAYQFRHSRERIYLVAWRVRKFRHSHEGNTLALVIQMSHLNLDAPHSSNRFRMSGSSFGASKTEEMNSLRSVALIRNGQFFRTERIGCRSDPAKGSNSDSKP